MQLVVDVVWEWFGRGKRKEQLKSKPTLLQLCSLPTLIKNGLVEIKYISINLLLLSFYRRNQGNL